jgi:putative FmdB family regulatory protein
LIFINRRFIVPTYEFGCVNCGQTLEVFATIAEKEKGLNLRCSGCGSKKVVQVFSSVNFAKSGGKCVGKAFPMAGGCGQNAGPGCCG